MTMSRFVTVALTVVPVLHTAGVFVLLNRVDEDQAVLLLLISVVLQIVVVFMVARRARRLPADPSPRRLQRAQRAMAGAIASFLYIIIASVVPNLFAEGIVKGRFDALLPDYVKLGTLEPVQAAPYLAGKAVLINVGDRVVDNRQFEIDSAIRALSPQEVGSVVLLSWGSHSVSSGGIRTYEVESGKTVAVRHDYQETKSCVVTVIDLRERKAFAPHQVSNSGAGSFEQNMPVPQGGAEYPAAAVVKYLDGLPRR